MPEDDCRRALKLWREFDRIRHELIARLYNGRDNPEHIQSLLDENDEIRRQALELTEQVLRTRE